MSADPPDHGLGGLYPRLPYLPLLNAHPSRAAEALRAVAAVERAPDIDRALLAALGQVNWRPHLLACAVLLVRAQRGPVDEALIAALWARVDDWSWAAPQCCATASMIDPRFDERVAARLERLLSSGPDGGPSAKAIQALMALVGPTDAVRRVEASPALVEWVASAETRAERAVRWRDAMRAALAGGGFRSAP